MNIQKGGQALKDCIEENAESLKNSRLFSSLIDDMLGGFEYRAEKIVLKHATESYVLRSLFEAAEITPDMARRAVEQFKTEIRMTQEDAEFTVKCIIVARGGNPDIVTGAASQREEEEKRKRQEEQKRREEELRRREEEQKRREEELKRREEEWKRREEEQKRQEEERKRKEEQRRQEEELRRREEEQKRREEELRRREEEQRRREIEQRRQEEDRKRREEEQRRQEEERKRREEEQRRQEEDRRLREEEQRSQISNESSTNFIVQACQKLNIKNSSFVIVGNPISISSKQYINAKKNFNIPNNEEIFLIYDDKSRTLLGSCKEGAALCTSGIYRHYRNREDKYISWRQLKTLNVYTRYYYDKKKNGIIGGLMIDKEIFAPYDGCCLAPLLPMVLADIQGNLRARSQTIDYETLIKCACEYVGKIGNYCTSVIYDPIMQANNNCQISLNCSMLAKEGIKEKIVYWFKAEEFKSIALGTSGIHIYNYYLGEWTYTYIPWETVISARRISFEANNQIMIGDVAFYIPSAFPARIIGDILIFIKNQCSTITSPSKKSPPQEWDVFDDDVFYY